jgi:predicted membrane protein
LIYSNRLLIEVNAIFTALLFAQLFMSVSSTVYAISLRGFIFLFWGASLSLMRSIQNDNEKKLLTLQPDKVIAQG